MFVIFQVAPLLRLETLIIPTVTYSGRVGYPQFKGGVTVEVLEDIPNEFTVLQIYAVSLLAD
jgi:hypothetical protein